ncbi:MAG: hypothetical protein U0175_39255 [Caldilineaceae bacterium]
MKNRLLRFLFLLFILYGCAACEPAPDAWQNGAPGGAPSQASLLAPESVFMVQATQNDKVVARLQDTSAILLSEAEAKELVGEAYRSQSDTKPYLVRALVKCCLGSSSVYRLEGDLYVWSIAMGSPAYHRTGLVVNLDFPPKTVYVSLGFVE